MVKQPLTRDERSELLMAAGRRDMMTITLPAGLVVDLDTALSRQDWPTEYGIFSEAVREALRR